MPHYLRLFFHTGLRQRPAKPEGKNKADLYNLGYVQNVKKDQVIAEITPLPIGHINPRFVIQNPIFPMGPNTHVDPKNPLKLLSSIQGHVFYDGSNICVHSTVHVRSDVSFHTGNILFEGDTAIHGNVRSGFVVQGKNVLVEGMVEGGRVRTKNDLAVRGGARGGRGKPCVLVAKKNIRIGFAEKIEVHAGGNIIIENNSLHSKLYAGHNTLIRGHLWGGHIHCLQGTMITGNAGNKAGVPTRIYLGYDPDKMRRIEGIDKQLDIVKEKLRHLISVAGHIPKGTSELSKKLEKMLQKQEGLMRAKHSLWERVAPHANYLHHCKVVILGQVSPGVEIAIGTAFLYVDEPLEKVVFSVVDHAIVCTPYKEKSTS